MIFIIYEYQIINEIELNLFPIIIFYFLINLIQFQDQKFNYFITHIFPYNHLILIIKIHITPYPSILKPQSIQSTTPKILPHTIIIQFKFINCFLSFHIFPIIKQNFNHNFNH